MRIETALRMTQHDILLGLQKSIKKQAVMISRQILSEGARNQILILNTPFQDDNVFKVTEHTNIACELNTQLLMFKCLSQVYYSFTEVSDGMNVIVSNLEEAMDVLKQYLATPTNIKFGIILVTYLQPKIVQDQIYKYLASVYNQPQFFPSIQFSKFHIKGTVTFQRTIKYLLKHTDLSSTFYENSIDVDLYSSQFCRSNLITSLCEDFVSSTKLQYKIYQILEELEKTQHVAIDKERFLLLLHFDAKDNSQFIDYSQFIIRGSDYQPISLKLQKSLGIKRESIINLQDCLKLINDANLLQGGLEFINSSNNNLTRDIAYQLLSQSTSEGFVLQVIFCQQDIPIDDLLKICCKQYDITELSFKVIINQLQDFGFINVKKQNGQIIVHRYNDI